MLLKLRAMASNAAAVVVAEYCGYNGTNKIFSTPASQRALIWLFYFDELSLKEIVEITNMSEANVKVKLHRARKKLLTIVKENVEPALIASYGRK